MRRSLLLLVFLACSATAFAQIGEVSLSFGESKARNNSLGAAGSGDLTVDTNFHMAFRLTINSYKFFGHEIGYGYNHGNIKIAGTSAGSMPIHQGFYDFLVYATPEGSRIRPFGAGGVHFSTFIPPGASVFSGNGTTKFGLNYGGGVKFRVTSSFLGRVDVRDYFTGKPDFGTSPQGKLHQLEISAGLGFIF